ncbi:transposase [Azospirillum sp. OGB3]|uniref:IS66-like element accessory protein TnpA n=1 Tax=Azospirillum sp. OGB3 TaxID=2587012 RepID=UPI0032B74356
MAVQRIEVSAGGWRTYSPEERIRLVGEAQGGRSTVAAVVGRHGVCTSLIYRWRRQLKSGELSAEAPGSVPVHVLEATPAGLPSPVMTPSAPDPAPSAERRSALVEVVLSIGCVLRVAEDIAPATLRRLVGALDAP